MTATSQSPAPQHGPALGRTHRLLGRFHFTGVFWYRFAHWAFTRLPPWTEWVIVSVFTTFFFVTLGRIRRALASNLDPVLGRARGWRALGRSYRTSWAFAWCFTERYRHLAAPERFSSTLEGEEHWREVMDKPGGVLLATAHIGPWETGAHFGASNSLRRIHIVREREIDPQAQKFVQELLSRSGNDYVTHFAGKDLSLGIELAQALRDGDVVALQSDRPRDGGRTVTVSLFGRPMLLPVGPAALARATDVPILPVFNFRDARFRMRVVARAPIRVDHTADRDADMADATHRLATEIEWAIRQRPHQWFCFRRLWD